MPVNTPGMPRGAPARKLPAEVPGIADVVWGALARLDGRHDPMRIAFVSAEPRAGTSVIAATSAIALQRNLRVPVALVEANVAHPATAGYLGLRNAGLSDILDGRAELADCLQEPEDHPGLKVLPAGSPRAPVPGELATERFRTILATVGEGCRYLVVDAPPVLDRLESRLLVQHADGVILVLRAGATRQADAERAHRMLVESGTPVLGSLLNAYRSEHPLRDRLLRELRRGRSGEATAEISELRAAAAAPAAEPPQPPLAAEIAAAFADDGLLATEVGLSSEEAHRRQIDILERRIAKLTHLLEETEDNLRRIAGMKGLDPGMSSIYRTVQGLSSQEEAFALKKQLMKKIFQANLDLKTAIARTT